MQSPPFPRYLVPPRSKYSLQHNVLKHPQLPFLPQCQRPSFPPIQTHPPYSPDLAPSDFHLLGPMKDAYEDSVLRTQRAETQRAWRASTLHQRVLRGRHSASYANLGKISWCWRRLYGKKYQFCKGCNHYIYIYININVNINFIIIVSIVSEKN